MSYYFSIRTINTLVRICNNNSHRWSCYKNMDDVPFDHAWIHNPYYSDKNVWKSLL